MSQTGGQQYSDTSPFSIPCFGNPSSITPSFPFLFSKSNFQNQLFLKILAIRILAAPTAKSGRWTVPASAPASPTLPEVRPTAAQVSLPSNFFFFINDDAENKARRRILNTSFSLHLTNGSNKLECLSVESLYSLAECNTIAYWDHL